MIEVKWRGHTRPTRVTMPESLHLNHTAKRVPQKRPDVGRAYIMSCWVEPMFLLKGRSSLFAPLVRRHFLTPGNLSPPPPLFSSPPLITAFYAYSSKPALAVEMHTSPHSSNHHRNVVSRVLSTSKPRGNTIQTIQDKTHKEPIARRTQLHLPTAYTSSVP